ncbi:MAG: hypothetical protein ACE5Z5_06070 [Candidatus Bathyarchaeia archaeon]
MLAVALLMGADLWVAGNGLQSFVSQVDMDMTAYVYGGFVNYTQVSQEFSSVRGVDHVETVLRWYLSYNISSRSKAILEPYAYFCLYGEWPESTSASVLFYGLDDHFNNRYNVTTISGEWDLELGTVVSEDLAAYLCIGPGDTINVTAYIFTPRGEFQGQCTFPLQVVGVAVLGESARALLGGSLFMIGQRELTSLVDTVGRETGADSFQGVSYIFHLSLDRRELNVWNTDVFTRTIQGVEEEVEAALPPSSRYLMNHLTYALWSHRSWLNSLHTLFFCVAGTATASAAAVVLILRRRDGKPPSGDWFRGLATLVAGSILWLTFSGVLLLYWTDFWFGPNSVQWSLDPHLWFSNPPPLFPFNDLLGPPSHYPNVASIYPYAEPFREPYRLVHPRLLWLYNGSILGYICSGDSPWGISAQEIRLRRLDRTEDSLHHNPALPTVLPLQAIS